MHCIVAKGLRVHYVYIHMGYGGLQRQFAEALALEVRLHTDTSPLVAGRCVQ